MKLSIFITTLLLAATTASAQTCDVAGKITSGSVPLPGVSISAANNLTGKKVSTTTEIDGSYTLPLPANGRYVVRAELAGFAPGTAEVVINAGNCHPRSDVSLTLASRLQAGTDTQVANGRAASGTTTRNGGGFQNLNVTSDTEAVASLGAGDNNGGAEVAAGMPPQMAADMPTESVAVSGASGQTNDSMFGANQEERDRIDQLRENARNGDFPGGQDGRGIPGIAGGPGGGFGGPGGGGPSIRLGGGGAGRGGFGGRGGRGRFNLNQPHGSLFYSADNAALDAKSFSLTGAPTTKPDYMQSRFGASVGGPMSIPHIYSGGAKSFYFFNYTGNRSDNPYDVFSTVPTAAERSGDFSQTFVRNGRNAGQPITIVNPATRQPFTNNQIPQAMINPAAAGLLQFIPLPNLPGTAQNFHYITSASNNNDNLNLRFMHNFGASAGGPFGGGGGGGRRGGSGPRNNINIGLNWRRSNSVQTNPFPSERGHSESSGWNVPVGWTYGKGTLTNNLRFTWNQNHTNSSNAYAYLTNVAGQLGISGVSQDPFDFGLPAISLTNYTGLRDITPVDRRDQTFSWSDGLIWRHGKHTFRFGADFRRVDLNTRTDRNARGSFVFTGLYSGLDFADFLLGDAQQASIQYGSTSYHFNQNSWDAYVQDDWRLAANLTLNLGLRYEYVSPYTERDHRIVNLDVAPGFTAAVPVLPGAVGPYTGEFPASLVEPDRNNFAPRAGLAWKPFAKTIVRAGYGVNYNTSAYGGVVQNLAFQPPFSFTQTNIATANSPLLLQNAFPATIANTTTNNYGIDRKFRLGYVQMWNLDIQRELTRTLVLNVGYNGSKGTHLDMLRAPNRTPTGLRIANVQPFTWEDSIADSIMHGLFVRARKRMSHGISLGGSYTFSKSIDNASSVGGSGGVVAQNDQDLRAERGLSSFDQPHRFLLDYTIELPIGENKLLLPNHGALTKIFGDWQWGGNFTRASGIPYTARVVGSAADIARGTNGTLRASLTGQPIGLDNPTLLQWFNPAAFISPAPGQFGNSGRNIIRGPSTTAFNMSLSKNFPLGDVRGVELRVQANNVFNMVQYTGIDTNLNSRTFGQVISVGAMRRLQLFARFHF